MDNKKRSSYYLAELLSTSRIYYFDSLEELNEKVEAANKFNSKKNNKFFYGHEKIEKVGNKYSLRFIKWKKLTEPNELKKIDEKTRNYTDQAQLKKNNPELNVRQQSNIYVVYRNNKNINYIDVLYKNDYIYLDKDYLVSSIYSLYNVKSGILGKIRNNELFNKSSSKIVKEFEDIEKVLGLMRYDGYPSYLLISPIHKLVFTYITNSKTGALDYKKLRDLGTFIKKEELLNNKRIQEYEKSKENELKNQPKLRQRSFFDEI